MMKRQSTGSAVRRAMRGVSLFLAVACAGPQAQVSLPELPEDAPRWVRRPAPKPAPPLSRYELTEGSARILRSLKGPIEVDAYVTRGLPQLDQLTSDLSALLAAYEERGAGSFKFRLIEAQSDEQREQAMADGLQEQPFWEKGGADAAPMNARRGFVGLVFRYGSQKAVIPALPVDAGGGLEFWVTNKIREIPNKADGIHYRIGVVTGKKELKLSDTNLVAKPAPNGQVPSIAAIMAQAFPFYQIEEVDLLRGASAIEPELAGLIITQPQEDYTEPELRRIDEFMMRGEKSLAVFASAVNLKPNDPTLRAKLSTRGLERLLDGYGIHVNKDAVLDHRAQFRVQVRTPSQETIWLRHAGILLVTNDPQLGGEERLLDGGFAPFFRLDEIFFPFASSLQLLPAKQPSDVTLRVGRALDVGVRGRDHGLGRHDGPRALDPEEATRGARLGGFRAGQAPECLRGDVPTRAARA
jgi:ABC-type uncharacterized transport system